MQTALARDSDAQWLPVFLLIGWLDAVIFSALNLLVDDYIYQAIGRLIGAATPFVSFSLGLYFLGALIGLAGYAAYQNLSVREFFSGPLEWFSGVSGISLFLGGGALLLDLLFAEVFPRFDLPSWTLRFLVGLTLVNCLFFSVLTAAILYVVLRAIFPPSGKPARRKISLIFALATGALVIAVFLANDMRVQSEAVSRARPDAGAQPAETTDDRGL